MAYRFDKMQDACSDSGLGGVGHATPVAAAQEVHAGAGGCSKCGCKGFENYGANKDQCGNTSCAHSWSDHY